MFQKILYVLVVVSLVIIPSKPRQADLIAEARKLHETLPELVNRELNLNLVLLPLYSEELNAQGNSTYVTAKVDIQTIVSNINRDLYTVHDNAEASGTIDMDEFARCLLQHQSDLNRVPATIQHQIRGCIWTTESQGTYFVDRNLVEINNTLIIVGRLYLQISQCELLDEVEECIIPVIEDIAVSIVDLPARIEEDSIKTRAVIQTLEIDLDTCASDRIASVSNFGTGVISSIKSCAKITT